MKKLYTIIAIITLTSCKGQNTFLTSNEKNITKILRLILDESDRSDGAIVDKILENVSIPKNREWSFLLDSGYMSLLRNFDVNESSDIVNFEDIITKQDMAKMKKQIRTNSYENWSSLLGRNTSLVADTESKAIHLSIPVFTKNGNYALLYMEGSSYGSLNVYKRINTTWVYYAQTYIWQE